MEDIIIKVRSDLMNYDLRFESKVNIVQGDSATGKSTLLRILDDDENSGSVIESNYKLYHLDYKTAELITNWKEDIVYIIDENDGVEKKVIIDLINQNKYKFIIITRELNLNQISYGIDQIYEVYRSGKYNINRKIYKGNLNNRKIDKFALNKIITEDSNSGYQFYKNYNNFIVESSSGNSNINKKVKNNQIVVIDSVGFGPYIKELKRMINNKNIFVIYPESFEWLILTSEIYRISEDTLISRYETFQDNLNREKFYEKLLKIESEKINMGYLKSKLNKKYLEPAQFEKINKRIEELFKINLKELDKSKENNWGWN